MTSELLYSLVSGQNSQLSELKTCLILITQHCFDLRLRSIKYWDLTWNCTIVSSQSFTYLRNSAMKEVVMNLLQNTTEQLCSLIEEEGCWCGPLMFPSSVLITLTLTTPEQDQRHSAPAPDLGLNTHSPLVTDTDNWHQLNICLLHHNQYQTDKNISLCVSLR